MSDARFLFGPADASVFNDRFLAAPVAAGRWATFGATCPCFSDAAARLGSGQEPAAILLWPGYASVPAWVWSAPIPVVALAHDPNLLWQQYREQLQLADLVLTDAPSAGRLRRAGVTHVRAANLYGLDRHYLAEIDLPEVERDIDILFVGNLHPAVQGERLKWLGRLARLTDRWRVIIATGVFDAEYRSLLRRAKVCFNRSVRGECNVRALEAAASGAVLFQEADHPETPSYLTPAVEYVPYSADDLEERLECYLSDEDQRRRIAARARERVRGDGFEVLVEAAVGVGRSGWSEVLDRAARRVAGPPQVPLSVRVWQRASLSGPNADTTLADELQAAGEDHGLAVVARRPADAEPYLRRAAERGNRVSAVGLTSALAELDRRDEAITTAHSAIATLEANAALSTEERTSCPYPVRFDHLRVGWDRAGFDHPDDPDAESAAKHALLVCRAQSLFAELTGELSAYEAAAKACPHIPAVRAALGCALAHAGRFSEAALHLAAAVEGNPFDHAAASALVAALVDAGGTDEAQRVRADQERLARVILKPNPRSAAMTQVTSTPSSSTGRLRIVTLSSDEFAARFGHPDTSEAVCGFTPARDTHIVLSLVAHLNPRRLLEVGTASGQMTANLTRWSPPDAVVYSLGMIAGSASGAAEQGYELPPRSEFARHADHFGTAHKALLITADSRRYDFTRLAPLDFAFIDGGHDLPTVRSDSAGAYAALRPGGCLVWHDWNSPVVWVKVTAAVESLGFPEPVYHVAGTEVAFLFKGEGVGAVARAELPRVSIAWDGEFEPAHSLAAVNRAVCAELVARGQEVALIRSPSYTPAGSQVSLAPELAERMGRSLRADVSVRHRWPPDFSPPAGEGAFVLMQPWEFGRLPCHWIEPVLQNVDEVWAYSRSVERAYLASGIPAERVKVVPLGVDPDRFRPGLEPWPLATKQPVKLLFVGGTIARKGLDVLLNAYRRAFSRADGVCLVVKEFGAGTFYRDQTAGNAVARFRADPEAPEIEYLTEDLSEAELPRLYAACDTLVHSYRGEGFSLPVLEAMACGLPVVVTAGGPTDEFVSQAAGWRIPAKVVYFERDEAGSYPTCGRPWWLEPDTETLTQILRQVVADSAERQRRGVAARRAALGWTWTRTAAVVEDRVRELRNRTPVRFRKRTSPPAPPTRPTPTPEPAAQTADSPLVVTVTTSTPAPLSTMPRGRPRVSLTMIVKNEEANLAACLESVRDLVDEVVVVDTGSSDHTRDIARQFGAHVYEFPWIDSFSAARNAALERATGDYAFWMDADDRLDDENRPKLRALFESLRFENAAYAMKCVCVPDAPGAAATAVDHVRLFRLDPAHCWSYRVHEQILPALRKTGAEVKWSGVAIHHVGYVDAALRRRKLARDLRLLELERTEQPHDPFTLFNLGSVYHELGDIPSALAALQESLDRSHAKDSIVRKLYAMVSRCHRHLGDSKTALSACQSGRALYPDDAELLFVEANLAKEAGQLRQAEDLMLRLVHGQEAEHFGSADTGLRGHKARHNLAVLYFEQQRMTEAESQWRAALADEPAFLPAHLGLGELYLRSGNWAGLDRAVADLRQLGGVGASEAAALVALGLAERGEFERAKQELRQAIEAYPGAIGPRTALMQVIIKAGADPVELDPAIQAVHEIDPQNAQARHNREVLMRNTGRWIEGVIDSPA